MTVIVEPPSTALITPEAVLPYILTPDLLPPVSRLLLTLTLLTPQSGLLRIPGLALLALVSSHWILPALLASLVCGVNPLRKPKIMATVVIVCTGITALPCMCVGAAVSAGLGLDARKEKRVMHAVALGMMWGVWTWVVEKGRKEVALGMVWGGRWIMGG
ncbi:hypothetical protein EDC01DRAFT_680171 [Geopyxis carbonaria]|nr:hypothetical protein EDC01DRAFT_680171 [Geopyxis carbonaria]